MIKELLPETKQRVPWISVNPSTAVVKMSKSFVTKILNGNDRIRMFLDEPKKQLLLEPAKEGVVAFRITGLKYSSPQIRCYQLFQASVFKKDVIFYDWETKEGKIILDFKKGQVIQKKQIGSGIYPREDIND